MHSGLRRAAQVPGRLLAALAPARCGLCGGVVDAAAGLCAGCRDDLPWLRHACRRCGRPLPAAVAGDLCLGACELPAGAALRSSAAALVYTYPVDALVTRTKFGKSLPNARLLGELLLAGLAARPRPDAAVPVLVPIPLHWQRLARRGFNQATEIARVVAAATGWPLRAGWLARVEPTRAQSALPRQHRQRNVAGAFRARLPAAVPVLLIDDVVTTGATALAAAEALRAAGATAVDLWAVARALAPGTPGGPPAARPRQQTGARYSAAAVKT